MGTKDSAQTGRLVGTSRKYPPFGCRTSKQMRNPIRMSSHSRQGNDIAPTQSSVVISIQIIELAMLARKCTAPSIIHMIYAVENIMVHTELKQKKISLQVTSVC
jgi:pyruvate carboxylase